jgi:hypothetical protein
MNRFQRGTHPLMELLSKLMQEGEKPAHDKGTCEYCNREAAAKKEEAKPAEPVNRNVARLERCGGEVLQPGKYALACDEPMVIISVADLDKFVSECSKIDKV